VWTPRYIMRRIAPRPGSRVGDRGPRKHPVSSPQRVRRHGDP
jgi:hypothetical protein